LKPISFRLKVLILFALVLSAIVFSYSFLLYYLLEKTIFDNKEESLLQKSMQIQKHYIQNNLENLDEIKDDFIILNNNKVIAKKGNLSIDEFKVLLKSNKNFSIVEVTEFLVDMFYVHRFEEPFKGVVLLAEKNVHNDAEDIEAILLYANIFLIIVLLLASNKLIQKILRPIINITNTAQNIRTDNFSQVISPEYKEPEFKNLINAFNEMILRLQDGFARVERFNGSISHELKTPLSIINNQIQLAKMDNTKAFFENSLDIIQHEAEHINKITDTLLLLTKYSKKELSKEFQMIDINTILINIVDRETKSFEDKNITLKFDRFEKTFINTHGVLVDLIFSNLIDNAIKYSNEGSEITLSLFSQGERAFFEIKDNGIGVSQEKIAHITEYLYRGDESRSREIKGYGLGLSLVNNSVKILDGKLNFYQNKPTGLIVQVLI